MYVHGYSSPHGSDGDPMVHCEKIEVFGKHRDGKQLARLLRCLLDDEKRQRLIDAATEIESEVRDEESQVTYESELVEPVGEFR